jgi:hypothetical protein
MEYVSGMPAMKWRPMIFFRMGFSEFSAIYINTASMARLMDG